MTQKSLLKMQILPIKNQNFEKPFRNPSNRTKVMILKKKNFWISLKKFLVPRMLSHCWNFLTSKFWRKSKETKRIFFRKFTKGIYGFDLGQKKSKLFHACVPLSGKSRRTYILYVDHVFTVEKRSVRRARCPSSPTPKLRSSSAESQVLKQGPRCLSVKKLPVFLYF